MTRLIVLLHVQPFTKVLMKIDGLKVTFNLTFHEALKCIGFIILISVIPVLITGITIGATYTREYNQSRV